MVHTKKDNFNTNDNNIDGSIHNSEAKKNFALQLCQQVSGYWSLNDEMKFFIFSQKRPKLFFLTSKSSYAMLDEWVMC